MSFTENSEKRENGISGVKRLPLKLCPSELSQWQTEESSDWDGGNSYLTGFYFQRSILMIILQLATALSLWVLVIIRLWLSIWSMRNDEFWEIWKLPDLSMVTHLVYSRVIVSKSACFTHNILMVSSHCLCIPVFHGLSFIILLKSTVWEGEES